MYKFIKKNSPWLVMLVLFYIAAVAAVNEERGAESGLKRSFIKKALIEEGYEIGYEVSVEGTGGKRIIEFISASSARTKNKLHIAAVTPGPELEAGIHFDSGLARTSEAAGKIGAVLAINGGYFADINEKIYSVGRICKDYKVYPDAVRHDLYPYFCVGGGSAADIIRAAEFKAMKPEKKAALKDYIQTKPMLVYNSEIPASLKASAEAVNSKNPRTAVALTADKKIICAVIEGRHEMVEGMSQVELAKLLIRLGAVKAINLDGGGSSTIVLNGAVMNRPAGGLSPFALPGHERPVHSIIYFKQKK
ncbi:MAG TPA: phosphodiester glycosidase family protein [Candidatus Wallbacteria bacterium]|nr:phosphodiester glycosidase family protein [Candidatus Wallbacteria bacterium]